MTRKRTTENDLVVTGASAAVPARRKATPRSRAKRVADVAETPAAADAVASVYTPSYQEIAALAYSYWEARGCQSGSPEEDWLRAERELLAKTSAAIA